jgi:hypothetical protein
VKTERNIEGKPGNGGVEELTIGSGQVKAVEMLTGLTSEKQSLEWV